MPDTSFISRFTPSRTNPDLLRQIFVQRHALLADTQERIRESVLTGNKHHLLFIGPRGFGKTHLVSMLFDWVDHEADLKDKMRVAWLNEDDTTTSWLKLLLRVHSALRKKYPGEFTEASHDELLGQNPEHAAEQLGRLLLRQLNPNSHAVAEPKPPPQRSKKRGSPPESEKPASRTLLVFVENLDAVFAGLGPEGQKRLRAFLQEHPTTSLVATSQQLFGGVQLRSSPFFGFFQIEHLQPLSVDDAMQLLKNVATAQRDYELASFLHTPEGRGRIRAIHHLSGGNHRVYVVLSQFLTKDSLDELVPAFERLLDELTPYYQERLRWLSAQQREIVECLCRSVRPLPVKKIAAKVFITQSTASSQLKKLTDLGYVRSDTRGRESNYELTEPLLRMSVEVKDNQRELVRLVVDFLRLWFRPAELRDRLVATPDHEPLTRLYYEAALAPGDQENPVVNQLLAEVGPHIKSGSWAKATPLLEELAHIRGTIDDWLQLGVAFSMQQQWNDAETAFMNATKADPFDADAWNNLGAVLTLTRHHDESLAAYDRAIQINPLFALAWNNRGTVLKRLRRFDEALAAFDQLIQIEQNEFDGWLSRGVVLHEMGRNEEALAAIEKAMTLEPLDSDAWLNRGNSLNKLRRYDEALEAYDKVIQRNPKDAVAWSNRATTLIPLNRNEEALESLDRAIEIDPELAHPAFNRVEALWSLGRWESGFQQLAETLERLPPQANNYGCGGDTKVMIHLIVSGGWDTSRWRERVTQLVGLYAKVDSLSYVGDGLVRSLTLLRESPLSPDALGQWRDVWHDAIQTGREASHSPLSIPFRLFDVGVQFLQSRDSSVLLDLPSEQRMLLQEVLPEATLGDNLSASSESRGPD
ncbi:MAG: tetratricopeptide repeat protein [Planctomycetaceae bacterium]